MSFSLCMRLTAGVIALVWPGPTALVLVLIVAFWAFVGGFAEIFLAFGSGETAGTPYYYRADPGSLLLGPRQSPDRLDATAAAAYAGGSHLAGAEQQDCVDLLQWLPGLRIKQRHGCHKEAFLVLPGDGAAVRAVTQIGEMAQEFRGVLQARAFHVVFLSR